MEGPLPPVRADRPAPHRSPPSSRPARTSSPAWSSAGSVRGRGGAPTAPTPWWAGRHVRRTWLQTFGERLHLPMGADRAAAGSAGGGAANPAAL